MRPRVFKRDRDAGRTIERECEGERKKERGRIIKIKEARRIYRMRDRGKDRQTEKKTGKQRKKFHG